MRLAAVVPAALRERAARATVRDAEGRRESLPPPAVFILESDTDAPEKGASVTGYSTEGVVARESWYLTASEAQSCVAREYEGRLGDWRPLAREASPLDVLADAGG